jgi:Domain of unknown function (DUF4157)
MHDFERDPLARRGSAVTRKRELSHHDQDLAFASRAGNRAIQRLLDSGGRTASPRSVSSRIEATRGGGESISPSDRATAERALKHDFSDVRIHRDAEADGMSRSLGAKAFTTGNDIYFKSRAYDPASTAGQKLLAHELTHVFQQRSAGSVEDKISDPNDASEIEAHRVADAIVDGTELEDMGDTNAAGISLAEDDEEMPEEEATE